MVISELYRVSQRGSQENDFLHHLRRLFAGVFVVFSVFFIFSLEAKAASLSVKAKAKIPMVTPLKIAGWIPFWKKEQGAADALAHLDAFTEISPYCISASPFAYHWTIVGTRSCVWRACDCPVNRVS